MILTSAKSWARLDGQRLFRALAVGFCLLALAAPAGAAPQLYGPGGVRADAVRQGGLGSCYVHATVAALAQSDPELIRKMIEENPNGSYTVRFADGTREVAYPDDIRYTRDTGYDRSEGLWVAVLIRAYAQRVLRLALLKAIDTSAVFPLLKQYARGFVATNDPLLLAYDRAIRAGIDQSGNIDRGKLGAKLKEQMKLAAVPPDLQDLLVELFETRGVFDAIAQVVNQNGELFGAYRAVDQGGLPAHVLQALVGSGLGFYIRKSEETEMTSILEKGSQAHLPLVAGTRLAPGESLPDWCTEDCVFTSQPAGADAWYTPRHAYTVLAYDADRREVTLRNPWGTHPDPEGVITLPITTFIQAFAFLFTRSAPGLPTTGSRTP